MPRQTTGKVEFLETPAGIVVQVSFEAETWRARRASTASRRYSASRCTVSIENAGVHTATYSAPPSSGVL